MVKTTQWNRATRDRPCPICGKSDWCGISDNGEVVVCMRNPEGAARMARNGGYVHRLRESRPSSGYSYTRSISLTMPKPFGSDLEKMAMQFERALNLKKLNLFAEELGVSVESLRRLKIGWDNHFECWTFPMTDPEDRVRGIRLRLPNGRKFSQKGGSDGLFIPDDLRYEGMLLIAEGPTDTAALLDLGFDTVGRPSCCGGTWLCTELFRKHWPLEAVIVADADAPGQRGAQALADKLLPFVDGRRIRIIQPPDGIKDARAWKQAGATASDICRAIEAAPFKTLSIIGMLNE